MSPRFTIIYVYNSRGYFSIRLNSSTSSYFLDIMRDSVERTIVRKLSGDRSSSVRRVVNHRLRPPRQLERREFLSWVIQDAQGKNLTQPKPNLT